jgi:hypothetical protein
MCIVTLEAEPPGMCCSSSSAVEIIAGPIVECRHFFRVSSHRLRSSIAKHSLRFYGTGGTAKLLQRIKWAVQLKSRPPTFVMLLRGSEKVRAAVLGGCSGMAAYCCWLLVPRH